MNDKCELAGMIWSTYKNPGLGYTTCDEPKYNRHCTWCNKLVCWHHSSHIHSVTACDECVVLAKKIVVKGEVRHARNCGKFIPTDKSRPFFIQYSGMHTKATK